MKKILCTTAKSQSFFTSRIMLIGLLLIFHLLVNAQKNPNQYMNVIEKVLNKSISASDFRNSTVFLTLDTVDASDLFCDSYFVETLNSNEIISSFNNFMTSFNHDKRLFYYGEFIESPFHDCRNILYGSFNSDNNTYVLNLWMDKDKPNLIEGITIAKHTHKVVPGGTIVYFSPR